MAGSPLSQVAIPSTPLRRGSDRIKRRKTMAASLRYGRLSIIPAVPWVRPSQGSETMPANGTTSSRLQFLGRFLDQQADLPVAGVIAQRDRLAVRPAQATLGAQDQIRIACDLGRRPAHAGVLGQAEQVARGPVGEHLVGQRQRPGGAVGLGGHFVDGWVGGVEDCSQMMR